jgi:DNA-packaging protein gp3
MGKNKYIETPDKLWEYFENYKNETKSNPIKKHVFVGKDGNADYELIERPLTVDGFEVWCWRNEIINDLSNYFANTNNKYSDYSTICSRIRKEVRNDQIEKGLAGIYNTSITQRLNGLTDKSEITVKEQPLFPDDQF